MAHFLITGGAGLIGSHLADSLIADGNRVTVIDDLSSGKRENVPTGASFIQANVIDADVFAPLLKDVDGCFHLAAIASVERARQEWHYAWQVNAGAIVNLFQAIAGSGRAVPVVYASSAAVYGNNNELPLAESAVAVPLTSYGAAKLACEQQAFVAAHLHQIPAIGLRFFNVYGPRQDPYSPYSGVISIFSNRIAKGRPVTVYGDGEQTRDFIYVADVVRALRLAMRHSASIRHGVFNVCTGAAASVGELIQIIGRITGKEPRIIFEPSRRGDICHSLGSPNLAWERLGFSAEIMLREGLKHLELDYE